jgi:hypothetical protein
MAEQDRITDLFFSAFRKHLDGNLVAAEALYREIIRIDPSAPQAKHYLGLLLQQTDQLPEAFEQLTVRTFYDTLTQDQKKVFDKHF